MIEKSYKKWFSSFVTFSLVLMFSGLAFADDVFATPKYKIQLKDILKYKKYCIIYEFHTAFVKITQFAEVVPSFNLPYFFAWAPSLYSAKDVYNIETGENIMDYKVTVEPDKWRGVTYDGIIFTLHFKEPLVAEKASSYKISFKTKKLPHLHTMSKIAPQKELHLGINVGVEDYVENSCRIVAIPGKSEINSVFGYLPTERKNLGDWQLFIYDVTGITQNISAHIKFKMKKDYPELNSDEVIKRYVRGK